MSLDRKLPIRNFGTILVQRYHANLRELLAERASLRKSISLSAFSLLYIVGGALQWILA